MNRLIVWCLGLIVVGCTANDPPAPVFPLVAEFTVPTTIVVTDEPLLCMSRNTSNGDRVEWRVSNAPATVYTTGSYTFSTAVPGTYTITLTAFNSKNESSTTSKSILVGRRYITEIRITKLNFLQYTGAPWHADGTGPNVSIDINDGFQPAIPLYRSPVVANVQPTQIPLSFTQGTANVPPLLVGEEYFFYITDHYGNTLQQMEGMGYITVITYASERNATGAGSFVLDNSSKQNTMTVFYQVR